MSRNVIRSDHAPSVEGKPFSHGVITRHGMLFTSGALGLDPQTGELVSGPFQAEALQALRNVLSVVKDAGGDSTDVIKTTVFLTDMQTQFDPLSRVYRDVFTSPLPARSAFQAASLARGARIELEAIAELNATDSGT